jgi:putative membrane protein
MNFYKEMLGAYSKTNDEELYKEFSAKDLILRDYLAIERTILTNEATFLAYIRTSLTVVVVGVTLFHISQNPFLQYVGIGFVLFGFYIFFRGSVRSSRMKIKIDRFLEKKKQVEEKSS